MYFIGQVSATVVCFVLHRHYGLCSFLSCAYDFRVFGCFARIFGCGHYSDSALCVCMLCAWESRARRTYWSQEARLPNHRIEYMNIICNFFSLPAFVLFNRSRQLPPLRRTLLEMILCFSILFRTVGIVCQSYRRRKKRGFLFSPRESIVFSIIFNFLRFCCPKTIWNELPKSVRLACCRFIQFYGTFADYYYYPIDGCSYGDSNIDTKPVKRHFKKAPTPPYPIRPTAAAAACFRFFSPFRRRCAHTQRTFDDALTK